LSTCPNGFAEGAEEEEEMTRKEVKKYTAIWNSTESLRAQWANDFGAYMEAMRMYCEMSAAIGQVS